MITDAFLTDTSADALNAFLSGADGDAALHDIMQLTATAGALQAASDRLAADAPTLSRRLFAIAALTQRNYTTARVEFEALIQDQQEANSGDVLGHAQACRALGLLEAAQTYLAPHNPPPLWQAEVLWERTVLALLEGRYEAALETLNTLFSTTTPTVTHKWTLSYLLGLVDAASEVNRPRLPKQFEATLDQRLRGAAQGRGKVLLGIYDYKTPELKASSMNIGDTMQSVAMLRHVVRHFGAGALSADDPGLAPHLETLRQTWPEEAQIAQAPDAHIALIDRDYPQRVALTHPGQEVVMILHGWFLHKVFGQITALDLPETVTPFIMSFYLQRPDDLTPQVLERLRSIGPVGCRDWSTCAWLLNQGVPAFFSGCVTTTLGWLQQGADAALPLYADHAVPEGIRADEVQQNIPVYRKMGFAEGVATCLDLLESYIAAPEVHTSRLHCFLPSRAIGANVTFHPKNKSDRRFDGLDGAGGRVGDLDFDGIRTRTKGLADLVYDGVRAGKDSARIRADWAAATEPMVAEARARLAAAPAFPAAVRTTRSLPKAPASDATVHVAIAFDDKFQKRVPPLLNGILAHASLPVHVHALTRNITPEAFSGLSARHPDLQMTQIQMDDRLQGQQIHLAAATTISTMDRLYLPDLLPGVDRLVYLDIDVAVLGDVAELARWPLGVTGIAARSTPNQWNYLLIHWMERAIIKNGLDTAAARDLRLRLAAHGNVLARYVNAGVLVMSLDQLRAQAFTRNTLDLVAEYGFEDQEAINLYLQGDYSELGQDWNAQPYLDSFDSAKLIHWVGGRKPWLAKRAIRKAQFWQQYDGVAVAAAAVTPPEPASTVPDWTDAKSYPEGWDKRAEAAARWLPASGRVADLGCGANMGLRQFLAEGVVYLPFDQKAWTPEVQEIDLNTPQFPKGPFDAIALLGVLEYLDRPGMALRRARAQSDLLVTSYVHPKGPNPGPLRLERGWINDLTPKALERLMARQGWKIVESDLYTENSDMMQVIYKCVACDPVIPPKLGALATQVREAKLTYLRPEKMSRLEDALASLANQSVLGDFAEFGLALGGSGIVIAQAAREQGRNFLGFDVFAQIPEPTSEHDDDHSRARYQTIAEGKSKGVGGETYYGYRKNLFEEVTASFAQFGVPVDGTTVSLFKGLFEETWPLVPSPRIAFAHVDCDWYDPVWYCLNALLPVLSPGGLILLDDYHDYGGAKHAVDMFLAENPEFIFHDGANVLLERKAP